jgi:SPOR domain
MSLLNGFNGQGHRPAARPTADQHQTGQTQNPSAHGQPSAGHHHGSQNAVGQHAGWGQPQQAAHPQQWAQPSPQGYAQPGYGHQSPQPHIAGQGYAAPAYGGLSANPESFAPSFEPYTAPSTTQGRAAQPTYQQGAQASQASQTQANYGQPTYGQASPYQSQPQAAPQQQWTPQPAAARGYENAGYAQPATSHAAQYRTAEPQTHDFQRHDAEPALSDWNHAQAGQAHHQGYEYADPNGYGAPAYAQPQGGELEQQYADEEQEYEVEEPSRVRRPMMIAAALAGAIMVGGGLAYGYKSFLGGAPNGQPPTVKSAAAPAKTKPADAGGKQFAHSDSKIMGRLGEGAAPAAGGAAGSDVDANGTRKVSTLVVGRDGSIQAPAAEPASAAADAPQPASAAAQPTPVTSNVSVPGMMVVDALGPKAAPAQPAAAPLPPAQKLVVTPPAVTAPAVTAPAVAAKPIVVAKAPAAVATPDATGSIEAAAVAAKKPVVAAKKVAAATTNDAFSPTAPPAATAAPAASPVTATGGNGYVAVLASVPRSGSSRMDALKRFADMQQKYGTVLGGKTPDVAEADLGAKGAYHRLVVGPPASREQASSLCAQLKSQGYTDCWVTSY